jgi:outer membrane protein assembly factor BamA
MLRADFSLPYLADERVELGIEASYHRHPQEDFYGPGPNSVEDDRVSYFFKGNRYEGRAIVRPKSWLSVGTHLGRLSPSIRSGRDSRYPSIEILFSDLEAPGLVEQPDFTYGDVFATVDYRDQPGNARAGGYYSVAWKKFSDLDFDRYDFQGLDLHLQQFFPVFDKKRVFAVQTRVLTNTTDDDRRVPFYLQPTIGGSRTLRSFSEYRFRDANVLYLNFEYRWEAFSPLDMALFTDWGKVASKAGDLDFTDLKRGYGIGFRINNYKTVFLRIDIAAGGGEGIHYFFKFSKSF